MTTEYERAVAIAQSPQAPGDAVYAAARDLGAVFDRGDHLVGLLPADAAGLLLHLYERAGAAGVAAAWPAAGEVLRSTTFGAALPADPARALAAYQAGARTGDRDAIVAFIRAVHFTDRSIAAAYYPEAAEHLNRLLSSSPDPSLMVLSAWMLAAGEGYAEDPKRARAMLKAAAKAGDADAHFELFIYATQGIGGRADAASALRHLRAAADGGNVRAMANLGGMYATGTGVEQDDAAAVDWYRRAADGGLARAARNLAVMYGTGHGAPQDPELTERYSRRADQLDAL